MKTSTCLSVNVLNYIKRKLYQARNSKIWQISIFGIKNLEVSRLGKFQYVACRILKFQDLANFNIWHAES